MKLSFATICDNAFTDNSGRLNIIQMFNTVGSADYPSIHPRLALVTSFQLEEDDSRTKKYSLKMTFKQKSTGKEIASISNSATPESGSTENIQFISYFIGLPLEREGEYEFEFEIEGEKGTHSQLSLHVERT